MKKKHSSGSLDPTKLVVGIGILAVIAVAAGLLSTGVGSLQGSVMRSSSPLRLGQNSPQGTLIYQGGPARDQLPLGIWQVVPNIDQFEITGIGFEVDYKNRNKIPADVWRGFKIYNRERDAQTLILSDPYLNPAYFDGVCETVPLDQPIQLNGYNKAELTLIANYVPALRAEFLPALCITGTTSATTPGNPLKIQGPVRVIAELSPNSPPLGTLIQRGVSEQTIGKWILRPEVPFEASIDDIHFDVGSNQRIADRGQLILGNGQLVTSTALTDATFFDNNCRTHGVGLPDTPMYLPVNGVEIALNTDILPNAPLVELKPRICVRTSWQGYYAMQANTSSVAE